ncbi:MAG: heparan-alpha-glucosaminide N-acetyltransferase domain-containing protein [Promethearchaeota archaeon]
MKTFDIFRGYAIFLMIMAHTAGHWMVWESQWLQGVLFILLNPSGTAGFIFASGLGFGFSWRRSAGKPGVSREETNLKSISRSFVILILGFILNIIRVGLTGFKDWTQLWYWNLIFTIGAARLVGLVVADWTKWVRFALAAGFVVLVPVLVTTLYPLYGVDPVATGVFYLLFNPLFAGSILVFYPVFQVGVLLGEDIHDLVTSEKTREKPTKARGTLRSWAFVGVGLVALAVVLSIPPWTIHTGWEVVVDWLNTHPAINIDRLPLMFQTNSFGWVIYSAGFNVLLTLAIFFIVDLKRAIKRDLKNIFGRYSLTIYLGHQFVFLFHLQVNYWTFFPVVAIFECSVWLACYLLDRRWHQKASLEALILICANGLYLRLKKSAGRPQFVGEKKTGKEGTRR